MSTNLRAVCAELLFQVLENGQSLRQLLPAAQAPLTSKDKAWIQEMTYGSLRRLPLLQHWLRPCLNKPLKGKQKVIEHLILIGFYQLAFSRVSEHAAVSETVSACMTLKQPRLKGLVNAILREFQRNKDTMELPLEGNLASGLPNWFHKAITQTYADYQAIFDAMNQPAPMWLRVNQQKTSREHFSQALSAQQVGHDIVATHPQAVILHSTTDVTQLPGYAEGWFAVQDGAAQLAAHYLNPQAGERILDACAAPGGKTCHIAELQPELKQLVALDNDQYRLARVEQNLQRLGHHADIICADAAQASSWWDGQPFDRILLDAPCSATGVIRRHPDIRWLRKQSDITALCQLQRDILQTMWSLLRPGGHLLYASCSVLPEENSQQIKQFVNQQSDANLVPLPEIADHDSIGRQILPAEQQMDGFYYALLLKSE